MTTIQTYPIYSQATERLHCAGMFLRTAKPGSWSGLEFANMRPGTGSEDLNREAGS